MNQPFAPLPLHLRDLHGTRLAIAQGQGSFAAVMEQCIAAALSPDCADAFAQLDLTGARLRAGQADAQRMQQPDFWSDGNCHPLAGLAVSTKDLFDVAGQATRASSPVLSDAPAALQDAPAVARLRDAGAALLGRSHMVEFAFSGVGVNPHFGTPAAWDGRHHCRVGGDGSPARVPGGSSSGAAVSVARGAAFVALGSDTGGSIRIPAALNGIVGFKNTARLVPTAGAIPLSPSLDTACAMTRSVRDATLVHALLSGQRVPTGPLPALAALKLAVPRTLFLDALEPCVAKAFERSLGILRAAGAQIDEIDLPQTAELVPMQALASLSPAESYAWHRPLLAQAAHLYDPRVRTRIERGASMLAADYLQLLRARTDWIASMQQAIAGYAALLSPTVPISAPELVSVAPGQARDQEFFRINALLLRNTSVINMLDGCALSLPCHARGELPAGLMLWHGALHDDALLAIGAQVEMALALKLYN